MIHKLRARAVRGASLALVSVLLVNACAPNSNDDQVGARSPSNPGQEPPSARAGEASEELALEDVAALPESDDRLVWKARELLVADCASRLGRNYEPAPYPEGGSLTLRQYIYPPEAAVAQHGYLWADAFAETTPPPEDLDRLQDAGDCFEDAAQVLSQQDFADAQQVFYSAADEIRSEILTSNEYQERLASWMICMASQGYDFVDPGAAFASAAPDYSSAEAVAIAVADFGCQREVDLEGLRRRLRTAAVRRWLEENPGAIESLNSTRADYIEAAKSVVGTDSGP